MAEEVKTYLSFQVMNLEEERNAVVKKMRDLENIIKNRDDVILKLKTGLQIEKFKSNLYAQLITRNTNIKLSDIYKEDKEGVHIYNYENGNVPVIVHEYFEGNLDVNAIPTESEIRKYTIPMKKNHPQSGKMFRQAPKDKIIEENPEEDEKKIKKADAVLETIVQENNLSITPEGIMKEISAIFKEITKNRVCPKKSLEDIKKLRTKLLGTMKMEDYTKLIKSHVKSLETALTNKKQTPAKIIELISLSLSPLEQRLVFYGKYYNAILDADEIQTFKLALTVHMEYPRQYVTFSFTDLYEKTHNYSLAIFPLRDILKRVLINPYGFPNLVYLDLETSADSIEEENTNESQPSKPSQPSQEAEFPKKKIKPDDAYRFYVLETLKPKGQRCWKMECRLFEFSKIVSQQIKSYCITLFRKIYFGIFNDNIYREDYKDKALITQQDCEQLLINMITLSKPKKFCNVLRSLIFKHCAIHPSSKDVFNFQADDKMNRKDFLKEEDTEEEACNSIKMLFDDLSDDNAKKILYEKLE